MKRYAYPLPGGRTLRATIATRNAAFTDDPDAEVGRILAKAEHRADLGETEGSCMDYNGNTVGAWRVTR